MANNPMTDDELRQIASSHGITWDQEKVVRPLAEELLAARATLSAIRDLCRDRDNVYSEKLLTIIDNTEKG